MLTQAITLNIADIKQSIQPVHWEKKKYIPFNETVTLDACVPPVTVAYHLLQIDKAQIPTMQTKHELKALLQKLFHQISVTNFARKNSAYLNYLTTHGITQDEMVAAHQEFLTEYLQNNSKKLSLISRWLGFKGLLNQATNNTSYLLMFHTFAQITQQPVVTIEVLKKTVSALLDEYLDNSWFINKERKVWAIALKEQIHQATDTDTILHFLSQAQINTSKQDLVTNKQRLLKPLHLFGHSRYQATLNKALNLAASLSGQTELHELNQGLSEIVDIPNQEFTLDNMSAAAKTLDKRNAAVLLEVVQNMASIKSRQAPNGIIGRSHFFNNATVEEKLEEAITTQQI